MYTHNEDQSDALYRVDFCFVYMTSQYFFIIIIFLQKVCAICSVVLGLVYWAHNGLATHLATETVVPQDHLKGRVGPFAGGKFQSVSR